MISQISLWVMKMKKSIRSYFHYIDIYILLFHFIHIDISFDISRF